MFEALGTSCLFKNFILEYLHIHNKLSWGWDLSLNITLIYVSYILHTHCLQVILYHILNNFVHKTSFHSMEFSISGVVLMLKLFQNLEHFRFGFGDWRDSTWVPYAHRIVTDPLGWKLLFFFPSLLNSFHSIVLTTALKETGSRKT